MKLDGRLGCDGVYGAATGLGDNGTRPERPPTAAMTTATMATAGHCRNDRGLQMSPQEPCDCDSEARGQVTAAGPAAVPKTSAVGSSLFTIDSILAPSRPSDAAAAAAVTTAAGRNNVTAATAAAAGFFKQPINFGHLAAAAAASGYAHSTAANFLGEFYTLVVITFFICYNVIQA